MNRSQNRGVEADVHFWSSWSNFTGLTLEFLSERFVCARAGHLVPLVRMLCVVQVGLFVRHEQSAYAHIQPVLCGRLESERSCSKMAGFRFRLEGANGTLEIAS